MSSKSSKDLITERSKTHGDWNFQAATSRKFKAVIAGAMACQPESVTFTASQVEALDMIAVKMSRILCGNPNEPDHWDDIMGYALLGKGGHQS